jgi:uncharacterized protein involved in outer membrane biogenesis
MKIIKIISAGLGLLLIAAIAWGVYLLLYLNENKGLLEQRFSAGLGREVRIEQGLSVRWSVVPEITLDGLWIGNPTWAEGDYFVRADQALVRINLPALLRKRLNVEALTVQGADLRLETAKDGRGNWSFGDDADGGGTDVALQSITIKDSRLSHRSPDGKVRRANIPEVRLEGVGSDKLQLKTRFTYRDVPVSASLTSRPSKASEAGKRPFEGQVEMPGTTLKVAGALKGPFELASLEVALQSERLDLQKSVLSLWQLTEVTGSLQGVDGRFKTAGDSNAALLGNLSGDLKINSAALKLPAEEGGQGTDLALNGLSLTVKPKQPVRLKTEIVYEKQPYQVEVEGGLLAELFDEKKSWKTLKLEASGQSAGKPFEIQGDIGPLSAVQAGKDMAVQLQAKHDGLSVGVNGKLASLSALEGTRVTLNVSGPSLSRLKPWLEMDLPDSLPFKYASQMIGTKQRLEFKGLKLTVGESDVSGDLSLPVEGAGPVEASLESDTLDLAHLLKPEEQKKIEAPGDVWSYLDHELPSDLFSGSEGTLKFKIRRLRLFATELEWVDLDAQLRRDHLKLLAGAEQGRMAVDIGLKPHDGVWQVALQHTAKVELGELIDRSRDAHDRSKSPVSIDADLEGTGKSLKQISNSMRGQFTMVLGEGELSENVSTRLPLGGVLYSVLQVVDPTSQKQKRARLECAVIHLEVSDGLATTPHGLAMRTKEMNLIGGGSLKLDNGAIDIEFKTAPRTGLGLSLAGVADRFIRLTGTLAEPTVGVNAKSALTHGTAAWLTGGLSLLFDGAFRRLTSSSNPCELVENALKN